MKKIFIIIFGLAAIGGAVWWVSGSEDINFKKFEDKKKVFRVIIPNNWAVNEAFNGDKFLSRVVVSTSSAEQLMGNIEEFSVTVVSNPSQNQPLSTKAEFEKWYQMKDGDAATDSGIIKAKNEKIAGNKAVRLMETLEVKENQKYSWFSVTSWFINNNRNFYINMMGNGSLTKNEEMKFNDLLKSFSLF